MEPHEQESDAHRTYEPGVECAAPAETVHPADTRASGGVDTTPKFYWQLSDQDRALIDHLILEDEGYLAHDINWGRRMLAVRVRYEPVPDVSPDWVTPQAPEHFSDAVSAILQVAIDAGLDPEAVCASALATCYAARRSATASIRRN